MNCDAPLPVDAIDVGADFAVKTVIEASAGRASVRILMVNGQEVHRCLVADHRDFLPAAEPSKDGAAVHARDATWA